MLKTEEARTGLFSFGGRDLFRQTLLVAVAPAQRAATARERFLNAIVPRLRRQVLALPTIVKTHQENAKPVVVFTARKAVCVADSLESLRYWQPHESWTSTSSLDGDLGLFEGASVLVVEDLATSGRTIAETVQTVRAAGAASISFFALAAEGQQDHWKNSSKPRLSGRILRQQLVRASTTRRA